MKGMKMTDPISTLLGITFILGAAVFVVVMFKRE
jgi:hypothetical protein